MDGTNGRASKSEKARQAWARLLPPAQAERIRVCGTLGFRVWGIRQGDRVAVGDETCIQRTRYACGVRVCKRCSSRTRREVYAGAHAFLSAELADGGNPALVTLTQPTRDGVGLGAARSAYGSLLDRWRATNKQMRTHATAADGAKLATRERRDALVPPVTLTTGELHRSYTRADGRVVPVSTTYDPDAPPGWRWPEAALDGLMVVEIGGGGDAVRYHPHLHVIVRTLAQAERLNAAWQATRTGRHWDQTDILPLDGDDGTDRAARYVAAYAGKGWGDERWDDESWRKWAAPLPAVLKGRRMVNGAGAWRMARLVEDREPLTPPEGFEGATAYYVHKGTAHEARHWGGAGWSWGRNPAELREDSDAPSPWSVLPVLEGT